MATCATHFLYITAHVPNNPAVENANFENTVYLFQIASAIIFNVMKHLNLTILPMKICNREHSSRLFKQACWTAFTHIPHCAVFPSLLSLSGCQTETSVVSLYANNCSLLQEPLLSPVTAPFLPPCHSWALGIGKSDNLAYITRSVGVDEGWQKETHTLGSRALWQLPPGQHPCPFTYGMDIQGLKWLEDLHQVYD